MFLYIPINTQKVYTVFGCTIKLNMLPPTFASGDYMVEAFTELEGKFQNGYRVYGSVTNLMDL